MNRKLPTPAPAMASATQWSDELRSSLRRLLAADNPLLVEDFLIFLPATPDLKADRQTMFEAIVAGCTPPDVYYAWQGSAEWATAVQAPDLSYILNGKRRWSEKSRTAAV